MTDKEKYCVLKRVAVYPGQSLYIVPGTKRITISEGRGKDDVILSAEHNDSLNGEFTPLPFNGKAGYAWVTFGAMYD